MTGKDLRLTCLKISNHGLDPAKLPPRLKLLNWGENKSVKGPVIVGPKTVASLSVNQAKLGFDRVALDYEHNTVKGTPAFLESKEPRKVAGFGVPVVIENEGLFLEQMLYTPSGVENAREYIDLSPAVQQDEHGEVIFIHSAALCRQGAVEDLSFYNVDLPEEEDDLEGLRAELRKVQDAMGALYEKIFDIQKKVEAEALEQTLKEVTAQSVKELSTQVSTLSASFEEVRREQLLAAARAQGKKVPPASVTDGLDLTKLSALLDDLEADRIPLSRKTPETIREYDAPEETKREQLAAAIRNRAHSLQVEHPSWSFTRCFNAAEAELSKSIRE